MPIRVKNLIGTSDKSCPTCGSWLRHWEKLSGCVADECSACTNKATVGGHVKKLSSYEHYITPLCDSCNKRIDEFNAYEPLVPAIKCLKKEF